MVTLTAITTLLAILGVLTVEVSCKGQRLSLVDDENSASYAEYTQETYIGSPETPPTKAA